MASYWRPHTAGWTPGGDVSRQQYLVYHYTTASVMFKGIREATPKTACCNNQVRDREALVKPTYSPQLNQWRRQGANRPPFVPFMRPSSVCMRGHLEDNLRIAFLYGTIFALLTWSALADYQPSTARCVPRPLLTATLWKSEGSLPWHQRERLQSSFLLRPMALS